MSWFDDLIRRVSDAVLRDGKEADGTSETAEKILVERRTAAPVFWFIGKTGAGKSSIIATLTGDDRIAVGEGFEPCTRTASFYDFPPEAPLVRFLDTRGLEEAGYDPAEDLAWGQGQAHVIFAVMRVADPAQDCVVEIVRAARRQHANWPVIVAQTALHERYPVGMRHPDDDGFSGTDKDDVSTAIPRELRSALAYQRALFAKLPGPAPLFAPLDFTRPGDGFAPHDFGLDRLRAAISATGQAALANLLGQALDDEGDALHRSCRPLIYGYATAAAGGAALPIPYVDFATIAATNALVLRTLSGRYQVAWTPANLGQFFGAVGMGALAWWGLRYGLQELLKLLPFAGWAAGAALNGAAAFSLTAGIGEAACVWLGHLRRGETAPDEEVQRAFKNGFARKSPAPDVKPEPSA